MVRVSWILQLCNGQSIGPMRSAATFAVLNGYDFGFYVLGFHLTTYISDCYVDAYTEYVHIHIYD